MGIGNNIRELRIKKGLTQKDLAEQLNVTYQAVSRWENDDVEPSIDTMTQMTSILDCSLDELFGKKSINQEVADGQEDDENMPEQKTFRQQIAVCDKCKKPIYERSDMRTFTETISHRIGRSHHTEIKHYTYCKSCYDKKLEFEKKKEAQRIEAEKADNKKRRIHSYVWSALAAIVFIILAFVPSTNGNGQYIWILLLCGLMAFTFVSCMILFNNVIPDIVMKISSFSVKMPGIIFRLDWEGLKFLIFAKILFAIIGFCITVCALLFAIAVGFVCSVFVYPFALRRNIKNLD